MERFNRRTLVWQLVHPTLPAMMECVAKVRDDRRVELLIERGPVQEAFGVFANTAAAIRTALRFEAEMISRGWQKVG